MGTGTDRNRSFKRRRRPNRTRAFCFATLRCGHATRRARAHRDTLFQHLVSSGAATQFEDVSARVSDALQVAFDEAEAAGGKVAPAARATTLRKLAVGLFHVYSSGAAFAVINLHCKNFVRCRPQCALPRLDLAC